MRSHEGEGPKQFEVAFRGYRREPVDEYVARLHEWLMDSEARAESAVQTATADVGNRVTQVLRASLEAGEQTRKEAEADAAKTRKKADEQGAQIIAAAERDAAQLRKRAEAMVREAEEAKASAIKNAQAEAARAVDDARREIAALQLTIDELDGRKAKATAELGRLQRYLAGAPEVAPSALQPAAGTDGDGAGAPAPGGIVAVPDGAMTAEPDVPATHAGGAPSKEAVFTNGDRPAAAS